MGGVGTLTHKPLRTAAHFGDGAGVTGPGSAPLPVGVLEDDTELFLCSTCYLTRTFGLDSI